MQESGDEQREVRRPLHSKLLLEEMHTAQQTSSNTDLNLKIDADGVDVHRPIIAAASSYFLELFMADGTTAVSANILPIKGVNLVSLITAVNYMYTGTCPISTDTVTGLLTCSSLLRLDDVVSACVDCMGENISVQTSVKYLHIAKQHHLAPIVHKALQIGRAHV